MNSANTNPDNVDSTHIEPANNDPTGKDPAIMNTVKPNALSGSPRTTTETTLELQDNVAKEEILREADFGDIIEVFWESEAQNRHIVEASVSPSAEHQLPGLEDQREPQMFSNGFTTLPEPFHFDDKCILFISPIMNYEAIEEFLRLINEEDRARIRKIAINHHRLVEGFDFQCLVEYPNLEQLIIAYESSDSATLVDSPLLPPGAKQKISFQYFEPSGPIDAMPSHLLDLRGSIHTILLEFATRNTGIWPRAVQVPVISVSRNKSPVETASSDLITEILALQEKEESATEQLIEAAEEPKGIEGVEILSIPTTILGSDDRNNSADGIEQTVDQVSALLMGNLSLEDSRVDGSGEVDLTEEEKRHFAQIEHEREERDRVRLEKRLEESLMDFDEEEWAEDVGEIDEEQDALEDIDEEQSAEDTGEVNEEQD
ncbi:hypothetical protein N431DRAFT_463901 [Stipitochalara longipes BDJ]|nr:hypothetical protein N431DRAFT_463901 [Stipitochalara longipes BDJ]